jgi:hypothetical protein
MITFLHKFEVERGQILHAVSIKIDKAKLIDQNYKVIVLLIRGKPEPT